MKLKKLLGAITMAVGVFISANAYAAQHGDPIGIVTVVRGGVTINFPNEPASALVKNTAVFQNQIIQTSTKGRVKITFNDESNFTIGRNAEVVLDKFVYDPATQEGVSVIRATKGILKFVTGKIAKKDPNKVKIKTPFATIGVRGSGGIVQVAPGGQTTLGLTQCCLNMAANDAPAGTPPIELTQLNTFTRVDDPSVPPALPQIIPPEMRTQLNSDLSGGFAPEEDESAESGDAKQEKREDARSDEEKKEQQADKKSKEDNQQTKSSENKKQKPALQKKQATQKRPALTKQTAGLQPKAPDQQENTATQLPPPPAGVEPLPLDTNVIDGTRDSATTSTSQDTTNQDNGATEAGAGGGAAGTLIRNVGGINFSHKPGDAPSLIDKGGAISQEFGDRFTGTLDTSSGAKAFSLQKTATNFGTSSNVTGIIDGRQVSGKQFGLSPNFVTYDVQEVIGSQRDYFIVMGNKLNNASELPTAGQSFYSFLPEPFINNGTWGFYEPSHGSAGVAGDIALGIDWQTQKFFTGGLKIDEANGKAHLALGFGDVTNGTNFLSGGLYEYAYDKNGGAQQYVWNGGPNDALDTVTASSAFGTNGDVEGFVLESKWNSISASTNPAYKVTPNANDLANATNTNIAGNKGFAAGFITKDVGGSNQPQLVKSYHTTNDESNVTFTRSSSSGTAGLQLHLKDATTGYEVDAQFGSSSGNTSVSLNDRIYVLEQGTTTVQSSGGVTATTIPASKINGYAVSEVVAENHCDNCQYVSWGIWAADFEQDSVSNGTFKKDVANLVPYVQGEILSNPATNITRSDTLNYSGVAFGAFKDSANKITQHYGDLNGTNINFGTRVVNLKVNNFNGYSFQATSGSFTGSSILTFPGTTGANVTNIVVNGALFGPNTVGVTPDIGGSFSFDTTGGPSAGGSAAGIYVGGPINP